jgi:AcrR family transcriptional regulator
VSISTEQRTQEQRSAATKLKLLDATVACLIDLGYRGTTMAAVADRAGLSRGAQLHHFGDRQQIIAAAVVHLADKQLEELQDKAGRLAADGDRPRKALQMLADTVNGPLYAVAVELWVTSRVDSELRTALLPAEPTVRQGLQRWCEDFVTSDPLKAELTVEMLLGSGVRSLLAARPANHRQRLLDCRATLLNGQP